MRGKHIVVGVRDTDIGRFYQLQRLLFLGFAGGKAVGQVAAGQAAALRALTAHGLNAVQVGAAGVGAALDNALGDLLQSGVSHRGPTRWSGVCVAAPEHWPRVIPALQRIPVQRVWRCR